jgi:hypothetical protein
MMIISELLTLSGLKRILSLFGGLVVRFAVISSYLSRLALKIVLMARQEAIVKRVWGILLFFTQIGFIVFTYLWGALIKLIVVPV